MTPTETRTVLEEELAGFQDIGNLSANVYLRMSDRIDNAFYFLARKSNPSFLRTDLSVVASATGTVISTLGTLRAKGCGVFWTNNGTKTLRELLPVQDGDTSQGWWWDDKNSTIKFTGSLTDTFIVTHIPKRTPITSQGQEMIVPFDEYPEFLVRVYERAIEVWKAGRNISLKDTLFKNALEELVNNLKREPYAGLDSNNAFF